MGFGEEVIGGFAFLQQGIQVHEFYGALANVFRKNVGKNVFETVEKVC